jgi:hypothetical protein
MQPLHGEYPGPDQGLMCFGDRARHVVPINVTGGATIDDVMAGAARVYRHGVEALHAHALCPHGKCASTVVDGLKLQMPGKRTVHSWPLAEARSFFEVTFIPDPSPSAQLDEQLKKRLAFFQIGDTALVAPAGDVLDDTALGEGAGLAGMYSIGWILSDL